MAQECRGRRDPQSGVSRLAAGLNMRRSAGGRLARTRRIRDIIGGFARAKLALRD